VALFALSAFAESKMAQNKDEVLKQGLMVKRSQNKKRFTSVNYKNRFFVLTRSYLTYFDSDSTEVCIISFWFLNLFCGN
jgi:hypothetical protein